MFCFSCHEGSLINLSQNQREGSSDKSYKMPDTSNSPYTYSLRHSQCVPKAPYDKYPNSTLFHSSSWAPSSGYHSFNAATSSPSPSPATPFMFGTQHSNADTSNLSQVSLFSILITRNRNNLIVNRYSDIEGSLNCTSISQLTYGKFSTFFVVALELLWG